MVLDKKKARRHDSHYWGAPVGAGKLYVTFSCRRSVITCKLNKLYFLERRPEAQHEYNAFLQKRRHEIEQEHIRLLSAFLIITKNKISNKTLLIFHARTVQTDIHRTSINV